MSGTSILICSPYYGGCGCVDKSTKWKSYHDGDVLECPWCYEDHTFQLLDGNFDELTRGMGDEAVQRARKLLDEYYGR